MKIERTLISLQVYAVIAMILTAFLGTITVEDREFQRYIHTSLTIEVGVLVGAFLVWVYTSRVSK